MSLIVQLGKKSSEQSGGGFYPQAHWGYVSTITDITAERANNKDFIKVKTLVENESGETFEENKNGPAIFKNDYFDVNISRLINAAVGSKENEGTLDPSIAETTEPDLSLLIGKKIGTIYDRQYNNPQYASVDRLVTTDKIKGCVDEKKYNEWLELRKNNKDSGSSSTPKEKVNPFAAKK